MIYSSNRSQVGNTGNNKQLNWKQLVWRKLKTTQKWANRIKVFYNIAEGVGIIIDILDTLGVVSLHFTWPWYAARCVLWLVLNWSHLNDKCRFLRNVLEWLRNLFR